jgi:hypothetical protein
MWWFLVDALYAMDYRRSGGLVTVTSLGNIGRATAGLAFLL